MKPEYSTHVKDLAAFKAESDVRKNALPKSPEGYEAKLPEGFVTPDGIKFEINQNDPALKNFRDVAHKRGMDQVAFSEALGIYAADKIMELQTTNVAREAERGKLGAAADARITGIETWLKAKVGGKAGPFVDTLKAYPVASTVEMFEGLIQLFVGQGGTNFNGSGRHYSAPELTDEQYDKMSFAEKRNYTKSKSA